VAIYADVSVVARLLGERARADMATALLSGEALTAGELAKVANLSPSAASPHLTRLVEGGLLIVAHQGRHRYYRLADPAVAKVLEAMLTIAPGRPIANLRAEWKRNKLWAARTCYDHLAGMLGVQLYDRMIARGLLSRADGALRVTPVGGASIPKHYHEVVGRCCANVLIGLNAATTSRAPWALHYLTTS
jgi:DNA-binding transcriptional ArsR family regulator